MERQRGAVAQTKYHVLQTPPTATAEPRGAEGSGTEAAAIALRVYVRFATKESAIACAGELHGKQFDGRAVQADFISEALFEAVQALPCFA